MLLLSFPLFVEGSFPLWNVTFNEISRFRFSTIQAKLLNMLSKSSTSSLAVGLFTSLMAIGLLLASFLTQSKNSSPYCKFWIVDLCYCPLFQPRNIFGFHLHKGNDVFSCILRINDQCFYNCDKHRNSRLSYLYGKQPHASELVYTMSPNTMSRIMLGRTYKLVLAWLIFILHLCANVGSIKEHYTIHPSGYNKPFLCQGQEKKQTML